MLNIYNQQIGVLTQRFSQSVQKSGPIGVTGLDVAKQAIELFPPNYTVGRSYQSTLGMQRELGHEMVLTADWARPQGCALRPHERPRHQPPQLVRERSPSSRFAHQHSVTFPGRSACRAPLMNGHRKGVQSMKLYW